MKSSTFENGSYRSVRYRSVRAATVVGVHVAKLTFKAKPSKDKPEHEKVIPVWTSCRTGIVFDRVCFVRVSPKWALYMINGKAYGVPHSQLHEDSEIYYIPADFEMNIRAKVPGKLVVKGWIVARLREEHKDMAALLRDAGIELNEYGRPADDDETAIEDAYYEDPGFRYDRDFWD